MEEELSVFHSAFKASPLGKPCLRRVLLEQEEEKAHNRSVTGMTHPCQATSLYSVYSTASPYLGDTRGLLQCVRVVEFVLMARPL